MNNPLYLPAILPIALLYLLLAVRTIERWKRGIPIGRSGSQLLRDAALISLAIDLLVGVDSFGNFRDSAMVAVPFLLFVIHLIAFVMTPSRPHKKDFGLRRELRSKRLLAPLEKFTYAQASNVAYAYIALLTIMTNAETLTTLLSLWERGP